MSNMILCRCTKERPTPMFGYNSAAGYWDIPFPDFTFWGHEHSWLLGERCRFLSLAS